jgi:predicted dehydrogenase
MGKRILIVGLGSIGKRHARVARAVAPTATIAAWRRESAEAPGIDETFTSEKDAVAFRPDIAVIATPATKHIESALPLARAGAHILMEKPIAAALGGVQELIDTCRERGVKLMVGYNLRFTPALRRFRELARAGRVGRVLSVRSEVGHYLPAWRPSTDYRDSASARAQLGGGVLLELSHEIDYLRWLFGEVDWVSAIVRRQSALAIDVEDTAHLTMGFAASGGEPQVVASLNMDFIRHDNTRRCTLIGESGSLRWDGIAGRLESHEANGSEWVSIPVERSSGDDSYVAEWRSFLGAIASDRAPEITGEDGAAVVGVVAAAKESSRIGHVVQVAHSVRANPVSVPA